MKQKLLDLISIRTLNIILTTVAVYMLTFAGLAYFGVKWWEVDGRSMFPALEDGDRVVTMRTNDFEAGDVVMLLSPELDGTHWVKRVVGVPGDIVDVYGNYIEVNGVPDPTSEKYEKKDKVIRTIVLLSGEYFLAGDNRPYSYDSRIVGAINERLILSEMLFSY